MQPTPWKRTSSVYHSIKHSFEQAGGFPQGSALSGLQAVFCSANHFLRQHRLMVGDLPFSARHGIMQKNEQEAVMPSIIEISDLTDPRLDLFARLTEAQLRNRLEPEKGIFIAESPKVIQLALDAGHAPVAFLMERKHVQGQAQSLLARCGDIPVYTADRDVLAALTGYPLTRGILCAIRRPQLPAMEDICQGARRVAVLEGIVDTTNVGAIFRSAAALHMDAVLLSPTCCDPLNRRAVRVSMGTVFQIPWARLGDRAEDWPAGGLERLHALGFQTVAMALSDNALPIDAPRLMAAEKLAIVLGTEGDGLAAATIARCDYTACIPMSHGVDSLNVAAASAVAFWQLRARPAGFP